MTEEEQNKLNEELLETASDVSEALYARCMKLVIAECKASTALLQRRFRIGYGKAAHIMDMLEARGVIAPATGSSRAREVLIESMSE